MEPTAVDWTREPGSDDERKLREAALTWAVSHDLFTMTEVLVLASEVRRFSAIPADLAGAEELVATSLRSWLGDHSARWFSAARAFLADHPGGLWGTDDDE
jgi:hypothetical protein